MYTVTISRFTATGKARPPQETGIQYASLDEFTAAARGELLVGFHAVSYRRCRTRPAAWWVAWRARRGGASAAIRRGGLLAARLPLMHGCIRVSPSDASSAR